MSDPVPCRHLELSYKVRELGTAFEGLRKATALHLRLNRTDLQALDLIVRNDGLTAGQLAERLCITTAAMTAVLDRLERSRLATREGDAEDRRRVVVRSTAKARRGCSLLIGYQRDLSDILARFSEQELVVVESFLDAVALEMLRRTAELRDVPR